MFAEMRNLDHIDKKIENCNLAALEASENILTSNINNRKNIYFGFSFVLKMGDAI